jgi:hypothetical protein
MFTPTLLHNKQRAVSEAYLAGSRTIADRAAFGRSLPPAGRCWPKTHSSASTQPSSRAWHCSQAHPGTCMWCKGAADTPCHPPPSLTSHCSPMAMAIGTARLCVSRSADPRATQSPLRPTLTTKHVGTRANNTTTGCRGWSWCVCVYGQWQGPHGTWLDPTRPGPCSPRSQQR